MKSSVTVHHGCCTCTRTAVGICTRKLWKFEANSRLPVRRRSREHGCIFSLAFFLGLGPYMRLCITCSIFSILPTGAQDRELEKVHDVLRKRARAEGAPARGVRLGVRGHMQRAVRRYGKRAPSAGTQQGPGSWLPPPRTLISTSSCVFHAANLARPLSIRTRRAPNVTRSTHAPNSLPVCSSKCCEYRSVALVLELCFLNPWYKTYLIHTFCWHVRALLLLARTHDIRTTNPAMTGIRCQPPYRGQVTVASGL